MSIPQPAGFQHNGSPATRMYSLLSLSITLQQAKLTLIPAKIVSSKNQKPTHPPFDRTVHSTSPHNNTVAHWQIRKAAPPTQSSCPPMMLYPRGSGEAVPTLTQIQHHFPRHLGEAVQTLTPQPSDEAVPTLTRMYRSEKPTPLPAHRTLTPQKADRNPRSEAGHTTSGEAVPTLTRMSNPTAHGTQVASPTKRSNHASPTKRNFTAANNDDSVLHTEHNFAKYPFTLDDHELECLSRLKTLWANRPQSLLDRTSLRWQNEQFRFMPLLAVEEVEREQLFDMWREREDWSYTTAAKYWSAIHKCAQQTNCCVTLAMQTKLHVLIFLSKEEDPKRPTLALTPADLTTTVTQLFSLGHSRAALAVHLAFVLGQRIGDVFNLKHDCLDRIHDRLSNLTFLVVHFRKGKTTRRRQPFSLHLPEQLPLSQMLIHLWTERSSPEELDGYLFGSLLTEGPKIRAALLDRTPVQANSNQRVISNTDTPRAYSLLSIRRGGLQDMAQDGASTACLLHHSRHTSEETLHRYLEWGKLQLNPARERFAQHMPWGTAARLDLQSLQTETDPTPAAH